MIRKQLPVFGFSLIVASTLYPLSSLAHNTMIEYQVQEAIAIEAKFDNGTSMSNAQVVIYAPDNPRQPWKQGVTDEQGKFTFIPDYTKEGNWSIKIRSAGHGSVINIPINSSNIPQSSISSHHYQTDSSAAIKTNQNKQLSFTQKLMMAIMGGWGFVGTALFFSRKNKIIN